MKIKRFKKLTSLKWLNMFEVNYIDSNGLDRWWQITSRANVPKCVTGEFTVPDAVVIVPFHTGKNKVVMTREYRVPLAGYEYGFPAGLVDEGETTQEAARRELKEETGLDLTRIVRISPAIYSSAGMTDESVTMVYVECAGEPSTDRNDESEVIEVDLISQSEASRLCDDAALKFDAKAWLVLSNFAKTGRL
ncbi:MAG: NUDIX hydrolase [Desulfobacterales bacterium]|jgi:ADP-ribose pyrophosphatase